MRSTALCAAAAPLLALVSPARAEPSVVVSPTLARPGDPVLVTVTDSLEPPRARVDRKPIAFFAVRGGYQAVFAVALDRAPGPLKIDLGRGMPDQTIQVLEHEYPAADVVVPDEYAVPSADARKRIEEDNRAIHKSFAGADGEPRFRRAFLPPVRGRPTSPFGEMRTFNGVARSQHLGLDLAARDGVPVKAINAGTVVLVRDCFLPGQVVVVAHGAGIASAYFHLRESKLAEGDVVERGAVVGRVGQTGRTTGPHVHVSVWVQRGFVDPSAFLRLAFLPQDEPPAR